MIAFAACVGTPAKLAAYAAPGLSRAMEPDSVFAELTTDRSIHEAYNEALEHFAAIDGLEALVLLHEDTELLDADFCARVRAALNDPSVAIAADLCFQARAAGRRVVAADLAVFRHTKGGYGDAASFAAADAAFTAKWQTRIERSRRPPRAPARA
jgi:hypothetical protein